MFAVLEGQISENQDLREVLEIVLSVKDVQNGVLRISSPDCSGRIGIFCGRYITGAKVSSTEETGEEALKKLLTIASGNFAFLDAKGQDISDLKQSLSIEIEHLLDVSPANKLDTPNEPRLEEAWLVAQPEESKEAQKPAMPSIAAEDLQLLAKSNNLQSRSSLNYGRPLKASGSHGKGEFNRSKSWSSENIAWVRNLIWIAIIIGILGLSYWINPKFFSAFNHLIGK